MSRQAEAVMRDNAVKLLRLPGGGASGRATYRPDVFPPTAVGRPPTGHPAGSRSRKGESAPRLRRSSSARIDRVADGGAARARRPRAGAHAAILAPNCLEFVGARRSGPRVRGGPGGDPGLGRARHRVRHELVCNDSVRARASSCIRALEELRTFSVSSTASKNSSSSR